MVNIVIPVNVAYVFPANAAYVIPANAGIQCLDGRSPLLDVQWFMLRRVAHLLGRWGSR